MHDLTVQLGIARITLHFPGARTLKDRRRDLVGLGDRVRHRFPVTWNQVDQGDDPRMAVVAVTTAGSDPRVVRSALDRVVDHIASSGRAVLGQVDVDVFPWHPSSGRWLAEQDGEDG